MDDEIQEPMIERTSNKDRIEKVLLPRGGEVVIAGIADHTTNLNEMKAVMETLEKCVKEKGKEKIVFLGEEDMAIEAALKLGSVGEAALGGDQQVMAFRAKELGITEIGSWDMSLLEQMLAATEKYGSDNAFIWILSQATIHLHEQMKEISYENVLEMLSRFGIIKEDVASVLGQERMAGTLLDEEAVSAYLRSKIGFDLGEVNSNIDKYRQLSQVAYPGNTQDSVGWLPEGLRQAALVAHGLSEERDKRFAQKIEQYSQQDKTVFVSCGGGHVDSFLKLLEGGQKNRTLRKM